MSPFRRARTEVFRFKACVANIPFSPTNSPEEPLLETTNHSNGRAFVFGRRPSFVLLDLLVQLFFREAMLLTISTNHDPATDLGYLLVSVTRSRVDAPVRLRVCLVFFFPTAR